MKNSEKFLLPSATKLGQGYIFTSVCDSVHGGSTWAGTPPRTRYTPGPGTPPGQGTPPGTRYTPLDQVPPGTRYTPWDQVHSPGPGTPPGPGTAPPLGPGTPPWEQCMPGDTGNKWVVHILLECILVSQASVILFTRGGGLPQCILGPGTPPPDQAGTLPGARQPPPQYQAGTCPPPRTRHPPSPRTRQAPPGPGRHPPSRAEHTGKYGQRGSGVHLTGMQSCFINPFT